MDNHTISAMNTENVSGTVKKGVCGSTLKLIAIITMLIDHTAAVILERWLTAERLGGLHTNEQFWYNTYLIMRFTGRLAFPLFCFLLVEGFQHTRNVGKYAVRLAVFALISEIPFDLALHGTAFYFHYQNVFFTLLIALLVLFGFRMVKEKAGDRQWLPLAAVLGVFASGGYSVFFIHKYSAYLPMLRGKDITSIGYWSLAIISVGIALVTYILMCRKNSLRTASIRFSDLALLFAGMALAELLMTDYSGFGVLTVAVMYGLRKNPFKALLGGCITLTAMQMFEVTSFLTLIPMRFYNGKRGWKLKYVFYFFYPVHLFLLYVICYFMNIV